METWRTKELMLAQEQREGLFERRGAYGISRIFMKGGRGGMTWNATQYCLGSATAPFVFLESPLHCSWHDFLKHGSVGLLV